MNSSVDIFENFYNDKKILITGHTGFKGSWLSTWLNEMGAVLTGYALDPNTERDNFTVTGLSGLMADTRDDVRNYDKLLQTVQEIQPEIIFHLAAQPLVRESYKTPRETFDVNVTGTVNILEAARMTPSVRTVVIITTDKCYENKETIWGYREYDQLGGHDPYSASKACAELVTRAYRKSFFQKERTIGVATVRAGNVIGGGDWCTDRIIPDCINALKEGRSIEVRSPSSIRPWQHVIEPVYGYLLLGKKLYNDPESFSGAWNFGPDENSIITVEELVDKVIRRWGSGSWTDISESDKPHETTILKLDTTKSKHILGWRPRLSIDRAIEYLVSWYKADTVDYNFNVAQISDYCRTTRKKQ